MRSLAASRAAAALAIIFIAAGAAPAHGEEGAFAHPLGPGTEASFRATFQSISRHPYVRGSFEQERTISRLGRTLRSSGTFLIAARLGMVWDTASPFPSTLALGEGFMAQSRPGGQRMVLSAEGNETFLRMSEVLGAVFSGDAQRLLDSFEVFYLPGAESWELGLVPRDAAIGAFAQRIFMSGDGAIRLIRISEQGGDSIEYRLSGHAFPAELTGHELALLSLP